MPEGEYKALLDDLLRQVRARREECDVDLRDLLGVDLSGPAFQLAQREGMATAFHEVERLLDEARAGLPEEQEPALSADEKRRYVAAIAYSTHVQGPLSDEDIYAALEDVLVRGKLPRPDLTRWYELEGPYTTRAGLPEEG